MFWDELELVGVGVVLVLVLVAVVGTDPMLPYLKDNLQEVNR